MKRKGEIRSAMDVLDIAIKHIGHAIEALDSGDRWCDLDTKDAVQQLEMMQMDLENQLLVLEEELNDVA